MPDLPSRAEWVGRAFFAEVAETLGLPTDHVIASGPGIVLYSTNVDGPPETIDVYRVRVVRDVEDVLVAVGEPERVGSLADVIGERPS